VTTIYSDIHKSTKN